MDEEESQGRDVTAVVGGLLLAVGTALAGYGTYLHLTIAAKVRAGNCDGCAPWHPLLVVAPMVLGTALVGSGGYLVRR